MSHKQRKKPYSGKVVICPDYPCRWIEIPFGMVGGVQAVVISFVFHQNRLSGYRNQAHLNYLSQQLIQWPVLQHRRDNG